MARKKIYVELAIIMNELHEHWVDPVIEYVDVVKNNPCDITRRNYIKSKQDGVIAIKWCRKNFGERGDGWDFFAAGRTVTFVIWSSKLVTMWELWQQ